MNQHQMLQWVIAVMLVMSFLAGCGAPTAPPTLPPTAALTAPPTVPPPTSTSIPPTPTSTAAPPAILGELQGTEGPLAGAELELQAFQDEACVKLAEATQLSDTEKKQLESCSKTFATLKADEIGQFRFSNIPPGWYKLIVSWSIDKLPPNVSMPSMGPQMAFEFYDDFLVFIWKPQNSTGFSVTAQGKVFRFTGQESYVINFDYRK